MSRGGARRRAAGASRRRAASGAAGGLGVRSPLASWFPRPAALRAFRRRLGRAPAVLPARDGRWRAVAPDFSACVALAGSGVAFQTVADRRYDRSGDPRRLRRALRAGATIYLPQAHEVLPRVLRLMVALRATLLGPSRDECSFLFLVEGRGREGMGLHHDDEVDAFWLQLAGRRTVTVGPPVPRGAPADLDPASIGRGAGWRTLDLPPGTLFYLPPRTPHRVVCHGRSLALSLTWSRARRSNASPRSAAAALARFPVAAGSAWPVPPASRTRLWTQVPAVVEPGRHGRGVALYTPAGRIDLPATARPLADTLAAMPSLSRAALGGRQAEAIRTLLAYGVLAPRDLPIAIRPAEPATLDGWRF